ncbi:FHA domain-containing protein [Bifidobacterium sp. 82T24]|uniref:FHA domain-containing protein n=1 Tax=Bifidobacterium pluvialisilvae TaxID=2834436 RepID=UPI001C56862C|nr:FHA domain-containing protein [Bifidobacterium pluvialisilvae]MBW3088047.1 FHA domain-containing protein [Bifidobacterium pluvialisilvae]
MTSHIPYPPPPEFGWYDDDNTVMPGVSASADAAGVAQAAGNQQTVADHNDVPDAIADDAAAQGTAAQKATALSANAASDSAPAAAGRDEGHSGQSDGDDEDWDSTVLSSSFTRKPDHRYELHNEATGQTVILEKSTLLGRKPSRNLPEGATSIRLADPTRTISRNHAAVSFDKEGNLWLEDYGSLNGTFLIVNGEESQVVKGTPVQVSVPCTVRIGDQFFSLDKAQ